MTYTDFIKSLIQEYDFGVPIYTSVLAQSLAAEYRIPVKDTAAAVAVAMKRLIDCKPDQDLRFFQKGIYYRAYRSCKARFNMIQCYSEKDSGL